MNIAAITPFIAQFDPWNRDMSLLKFPRSIIVYIIEQWIDCSLEWVMRHVYFSGSLLQAWQDVRMLLKTKKSSNVQIVTVNKRLVGL